MTEHPIKQKIDCITFRDVDGEGFCKVGHLNVTRIEACEKSGMHANIPYVRVWKGDVAMAEFCQHGLIAVFFADKE